MVQRRQSTATQKVEEESPRDAAAALILEYERKRKRRARKKSRRRQRRAEREHQAAMERMQKSVEVIKWCVVVISSVMAISLIIGLIVLHQVRNEVERVKGEVQDIQREAEMIREKIRHPMQTIGGALGNQLDSKVSELLGGGDE